MAGLAAILLNRSGTDASKAIGSMLAAAPHRGRQSQIATVGSCTLGVSSDDGGQEASLAIQDGLGIAFTGVLDNEADLANDLLRRGASGRFQSPAHLLIAAFRLLGEPAVRTLRGIYSVAVTDGSSLVFFRDHLGLSTLFYRQDAVATVVATEVKQVLAGSNIRREPDTQVLEKMFYGFDQDESKCAFVGVSRVPKASLLVATEGRLQANRYWRPEELVESGRYSSAEIADRFDELMSTAVRRAVTGNDLIALSGGLDSPTVAAYAAPFHLDAGRPLTALGMVYPDFPSCDESDYIRGVGRYFDIPVHTYQPPLPSLERLEDWVQLYDGPWPVWLVAQAEDFFSHARELGFRTILNGEMAEFVADMRQGLVAHLLWRLRFRALLRYFRNLRTQGRSLRPSGRELIAALTPPFAPWERPKLEPAVEVPDWVDSARVAERQASMVTPSRRQWRDKQTQVIFGPTFVSDVFEICQAAAGVRVRMPWTDVDLWEFFLSLPAEVKFPDGRMKPLVRDLMRGKVPDVILDRKDKTVLNDFVIAGIDYPSLRKWLLDGEQWMPGVDYERLGDHLDQENLDLFGYVWAKDLAGVHAFMAQW